MRGKIPEPSHWRIGNSAARSIVPLAPSCWSAVTKSPITSGQELAKVLTDHLRQICKTDHLNVEYFPTGIPYDSEKPPVAADVERFRENGRRRNYQYRKVERMDGGIGLLQVDGFYPEEWAQDTIVAAMSFLAYSVPSPRRRKSWRQSR